MKSVAVRVSLMMLAVVGSVCGKQDQAGQAKAAPREPSLNKKQEGPAGIELFIDETDQGGVIGLKNDTGLEVRIILGKNKIILSPGASAKREVAGKRGGAAGNLV